MSVNKCTLVGRLTRDPEVKYSTGENANAIARFAVAVNRRFKNAEGSYDADFINCVAFGKTAEFIQKYFRKGMAIGLTGRIQTGSYTNKDGQKIYTTDVVAEETEFVESKGATNAGDATVSRTDTNNFSSNEFVNIPEGVDEELPFV